MKVNWNSGKDKTDFGHIRPGCCFVYENCLYIKCGFAQQAVRLTDGAARFKMCGEFVTPVIAKVQVSD